MVAIAGWVGVSRNKTTTGDVDGGAITTTAFKLESWPLMLAGLLTIGGIARRRSRPQAK